MPIKTKIERQELYKEDYESLSHIKDVIVKANKSGTVRGLSQSDLRLMESIYTKYRPKVHVNLNCSSCVFKMINLLSKMLEKYGKR